MWYCDRLGKFGLSLVAVLFLPSIFSIDSFISYRLTRRPPFGSSCENCISFCFCSNFSELSLTQHLNVFASCFILQKFNCFQDFHRCFMVFLVLIQFFFSRFLDLRQRYILSFCLQLVSLVDLEVALSFYLPLLLVNVQFR